jgi:hypothetical protein
LPTQHWQRPDDVLILPCNNGTVRIVSRFFLLVLWVPWAVSNAESWLPAYALPGSQVDIDQQSIVRNGPVVSWRERQVMVEPVQDNRSTREIRELQWRKQADCQKQQMKILSRAAFAEDDALVDYEGARPGKVVGKAFSGLLPAERKNVEILCKNSVSAACLLAEPAGNRPSFTPTGQDFVPIISRQEGHQGSGTWRDLRGLPVRQKQAQLASISVSPAWVQVGNQGDHPGIGPFDPVQMFPVARAGPVAGQMAFVLRQAQIQMAIEMQSQLFDHAEKPIRGRGKAGLQPHNAVAANSGGFGAFAADPGRTKLARLIQLVGVCKQACTAFLVQALGLDAVSPGNKIISKLLQARIREPEAGR